MAPQKQLRLYLLTFNCARTLVDPHHLAARFFAALPDGLPDLIVLSLQEVAPIAYSFLGGPYLQPYYERIQASVDLALQDRGSTPDDFKTIVVQNVGLTAIIALAKAEIASRIQWIELADVGVGDAALGNKGAVGVRIGYKPEKSSTNEELQMTFLSAHLAPMEDAVLRRNKDFEDIVRNLVFERQSNATGRKRKHNEADEQAGEPLLPSSSDSNNSSDKPRGLYDTKGPVFFAGDLNYRASDTPPDGNAMRRYPQPSTSSTEMPYREFLEGEQLSREKAAKRTLNGFEELPVNFPPTYKYSDKQQQAVRSRGIRDTDEPKEWLWSKHRFPSWCDRILFLPSSGVSPLRYTALPIQPTSDHRPVALSATLSLETNQKITQEVKSPFPLNPQWKERKAAGRRREIAVGIVAYLALTREGNAMLAAVVGGVVAAAFLIWAVW